MSVLLSRSVLLKRTGGFTEGGKLSDRHRSQTSQTLRGVRKWKKAKALLIGWKITFGAKCQTCCAEDFVEV